MKAKDLIKMLQEADPTGEAYVRVDGGAIIDCEKKEGYWDGPYMYVENPKKFWDTNFVISTRNDKIDITTIDPENWIWERDGDYSKIKFDFKGYSGKTLHDMKQKYIDRFEKSAEEYKYSEKQLLQEYTFRVLQKLKEGWIITQLKHEAVGKYNVMKYKKGLRTDQLCQGECEAVLKSKMFDWNSRADEIEWVLNPVKGRDWTK